MHTETCAGLNKNRPILTKFGTFQHISVKVPDIKFNESPYSSSGRIRQTARQGDGRHAGTPNPKAVFSYEYTGCPRRNVPDFERLFLMLKYTHITQNTYVQS